jgi:hypothetical protein
MGQARLGWRAAILAGALAAGAAFAQSPPPNDYGGPPVQFDPLPRMLNELVPLYEGRFSNLNQNYFQWRYFNTPKEQQHEWITAVHARVPNSPLGAHVFYIEEFFGNDPDKTLRQRVVSFEIDRAENAVRMKNWFLKNPAAVKGAYDDPGMVARLTERDFTLMPECDVFWIREPGGFEGKIKDKACQFTSERTKKPVYAQHELQLSPTDLFRIDRSIDVATGGVAVGNPTGRPYEMMRADWFTCSIGVRKPGEGRNWDTKANVKLHDMNGILAHTAEGAEKGYAIRLRHMRLPYGDNPEVLLLFMMEDGKEESLGFATANADAERIAINLQFVQGQCVRDRPSAAAFVK